MGTPEDRKSLIEFYKENRQFILDIGQKGTDPKGNRLFPDDLHHMIVDAVKEYKETHPASDDVNKIEKASDVNLSAAGLTGLQLKLKLEVVRRLKELFARSGGKKFLASLFGAIDTVFESLQKATGIDEALKEIKDILTDALEL